MPGKTFPFPPEATGNGVSIETDRDSQLVFAKQKPPERVVFLCVLAAVPGLGLQPHVGAGSKDLQPPGWRRVWDGQPTGGSTLAESLPVGGSGLRV